MPIRICALPAETSGGPLSREDCHPITCLGEFCRSAGSFYIISYLEIRRISVYAISFRETWLHMSNIVRSIMFILLRTRSFYSRQDWVLMLRLTSILSGNMTFALGYNVTLDWSTGIFREFSTVEQGAVNWLHLLVRIWSRLTGLITCPLFSPIRTCQ